MVVADKAILFSAVSQRWVARFYPTPRTHIICGSYHPWAWSTYLVGGLEHEFYDFPYIGNNHRNWLSYFSKGWNHQPDIHLCLCVLIISNCLLVNISIFDAFWRCIILVQWPHPKGLVWLTTVDNPMFVMWRFPIHGGTPSYHPFIDGFSMK